MLEERFICSVVHKSKKEKKDSAIYGYVFKLYFYLILGDDVLGKEFKK